MNTETSIHETRRKWWIMALNFMEILRMVNNDTMQKVIDLLYISNDKNIISLSSRTTFYIWQLRIFQMWQVRNGLKMIKFMVQCWHQWSCTLDYPVSIFLPNINQRKGFGDGGQHWRPYCYCVLFMSLNPSPRVTNAITCYTGESPWVKWEALW